MSESLRDFQDVFGGGLGYPTVAAHHAMCAPGTFPMMQDDGNEVCQGNALGLVVVESEPRPIVVDDRRSRSAPHLRRSGHGEFSQPLQQILAAAQAVHQDIEQERPLARVDADLAAAKSFLSNYSGTSDEFDTGASSVTSAQQDRDGYAARLGQGYKPSGSFEAATRPPVTTSIDTGSGDVLFDATKGTADDVLWFGAPLIAGATGTPHGAVTQPIADAVGSAVDSIGRTITDAPARAKCALEGGTWDPETGTCKGGVPGRLANVGIGALAGLLLGAAGGGFATRKAGGGGLTAGAVLGTLLGSIAGYAASGAPPAQGATA